VIFQQCVFHHLRKYTLLNNKPVASEKEEFSGVMTEFYSFLEAAEIQQQPAYKPLN
jgi:hypothetical protein